MIKDKIEFKQDLFDRKYNCKVVNIESSFPKIYLRKWGKIKTIYLFRLKFIFDNIIYEK